MDLEEWEILSDEGLIDHHENEFKSKNSTFIDMDYFQKIENDDHEKKVENSGVLNMNSKPCMKENELVDMKIDVGNLEDEKDGNFEEEEEKMVTLSWKEGENGKNNTIKKSENNNIWKRAMNGMGAVVSFGFVAVTVSLIVFSNQQQHKQHKLSKNQHLHFQFYSNDKRFKQVVRRAKRLNEAISVMRGAPLTTAHITVGGYCENS